MNKKCVGNHKKKIQKNKTFIYDIIEVLGKDV